MKRRSSEKGFRTFNEYLQAVSGEPKEPENETPEEYGRRIARESIERIAGRKKGA